MARCRGGFSGSMLAVIYLWRLVEVAFFQEPDAGSVKAGEAPLLMQIPVRLLIAASINFGLSTDLTVGVTGRAAELLLGGIC